MKKIVKLLAWTNTPEFDAIIALIIAMIVIAWFENQ